MNGVYFSGSLKGVTQLHRLDSVCDNNVVAQMSNKANADDNQAIERRDLLKKVKKEIIIDDEDEEPRDDEEEDEVRTPIGSLSSNNSPISPRKLRSIELYKPAENAENDKSHRSETDDRPMCRSLKRVRFPVKNMESENAENV